jgi:hypothetical protein
MGPSRSDPARQVATFDPKTVARLAALRKSEMNTFRWLAGVWTYENRVPATPVSPAYCDLGSARFAESADGTSICMVGHDGRQTPILAFDPWSRRWMYMLTNGSYGILRSQGWRGHQMTFVGTMTMIGIDCEWKMTWTRNGDDEFAFVNEEKFADESWNYIDGWRYRRQRSPVDRDGD